MSELPVGWVELAIKDLCSLENGRAFKPTDWSDCGLPIVRIQNLNRAEAHFNRFAGEVAEKYRLFGGELLFAWSGTPGTSFGAHVWRGGDAVLNQHIFRVDFDSSAIDKHFFRYAINQKLDELINVAHGGVGLRHVTKGVFENTTVLVPPLNEQRRIADKLGFVLARVDACRERLDRVPGILKRFRQAVLAAATTGELTREWRENFFERDAMDISSCNGVRSLSKDRLFSIPNMWVWSSFGKFTSSFRSGTSHVPQDGMTERPVLRSSSVRNGFLDLADIRYLSPNFSIKEDDFLADGDLLFTRLSGSLEYVANCAIVRGVGSRKIAYPDRLFRAKLHDPDLGPYLELCFCSPNLRAFLEVESKSTAGHQRISMGAVTSFPIPLPPVSERVEIVRRVEVLFSLAYQLESKHKAGLANVERLTPALLAKAFRGELVPQDPNDEPAGELLARIRDRDSSVVSKKPARSKVNECQT